MKWSFLRTIFVSLNFLAVCSAVVEDFDDSLDYDPKVVITCDKPTKHVDVNTGDWITDVNSTSLCTTDRKEILKYCQAMYPSLDIRNIVEGNELVTVDSVDVTPYRCLVGNFESDALLVPPKCRFEHMHYNSECQAHDEWHRRASDKCVKEGMLLKDYGVLIPCSTGMFTGVEFVCCPSDVGSEDSGVGSVVVVTKATPTSVLEHLKSEISKFAKLVEGTTVGCDRKQYHDRRDQLEEGRRGRVQKLIEHWEQAEKRYKLLKTTDEDQATGAIDGELENFKKSLDSIDDQAKLERTQLKEEHHQCTQIDLNSKKNQALKDFVAALQQEPRDGSKILQAVQQYVKLCTQDRLHNLRYFEYIQKHYPDRVETARLSLQNHFKLINEQVNETMILLYKLPEIARQFQFDLPDWIPKLPALPTEKPTVEKSSSAKEPTDPPSDMATGMPVNTAFDEEEGSKTAQQRKIGKAQAAAAVPDDEDQPENEGGVFRKKQSSATFAAVIGLSCGTLVVMVIIVIAMAMRRTRPNNNTKTVLVDADQDGGNEQSHLINMQENGYENPTYKFYDY